MTVYLKAPDKGTMEAALLAEGVLETVTDENGKSVVRPVWLFGVTGYAGAILPTIWASKPVYDAEGNITTPGVPVSGYHCNVHDPQGKLQVADENGVVTSLVDWSVHGVTWINPSKIKTPVQTW